MFYFVSCIVWIYSVWFFIQTFSNIPSVSSKVWSRYLSRIVVEVSIFIWIMYFKVFGYLYFLFHFYFNYVILLFTIWLDLTILVKIFYLRFYDFMIRVYDSSLYCMFRVMSKNCFWQPCSVPYTKACKSHYNWRIKCLKSRNIKILHAITPYSMCISIPLKQRLGKHVKKEHWEKNILSVLLNLIFSSINSLLFSNVWPWTNTCSNNWIALSLPITYK